ncbi:hypothetical protein HYV43_05620 [Candidatus Micrarchaeota archaeon]|nr:hypothetical protein [Candidatus Micrarchaeota archaeon]
MKEVRAWTEPTRRFIRQHPFLWRSLSLAFAVRIAMLALAYLAGRVFLQNAAPLTDMMTEVLVRWDAVHYVNLALNGYSAVGEERFLLVFLPLYPLAIALFNPIVQHAVLSGLLVSFGSSVAAGYYLQKLARMDGPKEEAHRALDFFFLFPTAYFLVLPYTEALFMAFTLAAFCHAREKRWKAAGILGSLAAATRLQGILLLPALAVEAWSQKEQPVRAAGLLLVPLGLLAYVALNVAVSGNAWTFIDYQSEHWHHSLVAPWQFALDAVQDVRQDPPSLNRTLVAESVLVSLAFVIFLLLGAMRWLRPSYQAYGWLMLLALSSVSFQISFPRYVLSIFPLFFVLARWTKRPNVHLLTSAVFTLLMGGLFFLYAIGRWAF